MSGRIDRLLEAARDRIRAWLPDLADCRVHDGRVDGEEAQRLGLRAPAVLVALLEVRAVGACRFPEPPDEQGRGGEPGLANLTLRAAAFVLAEDTREPGSREADSGWKRARAMSERIAVGIATDPWELEFPRSQPSEVRIASLYGPEQDRSGLAVMAVAWEQEIEISEPGTAGPDRPLPAELYRGLAPETGAEHAIDYKRLAPEEGAR